MEHILVVEDEERIRELFAQFLRDKGYRVIEARDGQEALKCSAKQAFDLIVMDVKMPKLDGVSALQQIRGILPDAKIILTTGYTAREDLERVLEDQSIECLHKPFTFDQLMDAIHRLDAQAKR